jgi:protein ImuA
MPASGPPTILDDLRRQIARLERPAPLHQCSVLPLGIKAIDQHLPDGGLAQGALHELMGGGADLRHGAAAALFAARLLGALPGPVLWVLPSRDLFAPALAEVGLHPDRLIYVETGREAAVLPVAEEGLRHPGLAGVVVECARLPLTASRRLQLAAESSGVIALAIRRWSETALPQTEGNVARTRWRLSALVAAAPAGTLGQPRWRLELLRCRGGVPAAWIVEALNATGRLRLVADLADRPAAPPAPHAATG